MSVWLLCVHTLAAEGQVVVKLAQVGNGLNVRVKRSVRHAALVCVRLGTAQFLLQGNHNLSYSMQTVVQSAVTHNMMT